MSGAGIAYMQNTLDRCQSYCKEHTRSAKYYNFAQHAFNVLAIACSICSMVLSSFVSAHINDSTSHISIVSAVMSSTSAGLCTWLQLSDFQSKIASHLSQVKNYRRIELLIDKELTKVQSKSKEEIDTFIEMIGSMMDELLSSTENSRQYAHSTSAHPSEDDADSVPLIETPVLHKALDFQLNRL